MIKLVYLFKESEHTYMDMEKEKEKGKKWKKFCLLVSGGVLICLIATYFMVGLYFRTHFFLNITINGRSVSGMTPEQARENITSEAQTYTLKIYTREGAEEYIHGEDFGLRLQYDETLEDIVSQQQIWEWGSSLFNHTEYKLSMLTEYDETKLKQLIARLACIDPKNMQEPKDAYLAYDSQEGLRIVPEDPGSKVLIKEFKKQVINAVEHAITELSLEELHLYKEPSVKQDDATLVAQYDLWKPHLETKIVYHFDDAIETVDASVFYDWMTQEPDGSISFDQEQIKEYVRSMARKYNTAYAPKTLETSYGQTVTISTGPYGWLVNQPEEVDALTAALLNCESQDREPIYHQRAASHTKPDYGDTYVEINLSAQHLFFYKEGELLVESDFVSGNESRGWATPAGAFPLTYKERNATLKGEGYATPVSYWMPFNGNIGLHDSSWRSSFGKNIYKRNGSHGCINLPPDAAKIIYENIEKGMPILCYYLKGTEYIVSEPETPPETVTSPESETPPEVVVSPEEVILPEVPPEPIDTENQISPDNNNVLPDVTVPDNEVIPENEVAPENGLPETIDPTAVL